MTSPLAQILKEMEQRALGAPTMCAKRTIHLLDVAQAQHSASPSWSAVMIKAIAKVASHRDYLRQSYVNGLLQDVYQHPTAILSIPVDHPEHGAVPVQIRQPASFTLVELDSLLTSIQSTPVEQFPGIEPWLKLSQRSRVFRSFGLARAWNRGRSRANLFGTMACSVSANDEPRLSHPLACALPTLVVTVQGSTIEATLQYDPRLLTPQCAVQVLTDLERVLQQEILPALRYLHHLPDAA